MLARISALLLARQPLELPSGLFGLIGQLPLPRAGRAASPAAALLTVAGELPLALGLLLLPPRQLLQSLQHFVDLVVGRLLLALPERLVLVAQLVGFELEEIRQFVGRGRSPSAAAPAAALLAVHAHAHVAVGFLRALQARERLLLGRQRILRVPRLQLLLGRLHRRRRGLEMAGDVLHHRIGLADAGDDLRGQPLGALLAAVPA